MEPLSSSPTGAQEAAPKITKPPSPATRHAVLEIFKRMAEMDYDSWDKLDNTCEQYKMSYKDFVAQNHAYKILKPCSPYHYDLIIFEAIVNEPELTSEEIFELAQITKSEPSSASKIFETHLKQLGVSKEKIAKWTSLSQPTFESCKPGWLTKALMIKDRDFFEKLPMQSFMIDLNEKYLSLLPGSASRPTLPFSHFINYYLFVPENRREEVKEMFSFNDPKFVACLKANEAISDPDIRFFYSARQAWIISTPDLNRVLVHLGKQDAFIEMICSKETLTYFDFHLLPFEGGKERYITKALKKWDLSENAIKAWIEAFNKNEEQVDPSVLQYAIYLIPHGQKQFFDQKPSLLQFMQNMMSLKNDQGEYLLLKNAPPFLPDDPSEKPYLTMAGLSLHYPAYYENNMPEESKKRVSEALKAFSDQRAAAAWLYEANSKSELLYGSALDKATPEDSAQVLSVMLHHPEFYNARLVESLQMRSVVSQTHLQDDVQLLAKKLKLNEEQSKVLQETLASSSKWQVLALQMWDHVSPNQAGSLNYTSKDALLISLMMLELPNENIPINQRLKLLQALPLSTRLKLNTEFLKSPKEAQEIFQKLCYMPSINHSVEGDARNSWEAFSRAMLQDIKHRETPFSPFQIDMEEAWHNLCTAQPQKQPASWLGDLAAQGWTPFKVLGRTQVYYRASDGKYLAVKWQKEKETLDELYKEAATLEVLHKHKSRLGLVGDYPQPIGVYEFEGKLPDKHLANISLALKANEAGAPAVAYVYEFPKDSYFSYLHTAKESDKTAETERFAMARHKFIADLFTLVKHGLVMTQLADIFHRHETSDRDDAGRFMALNFLVRNYSLVEHEGLTGIGNGRLHHIEKAVQYVNAGQAGEVRDVGDSALLKQFLDPNFELTQKSFTTTFKENPDTALTYILGNFLAEYLLVFELVLAERRFNMDELDWKNPEKVQELAQELKEGFLDAVHSYSGVSKTLAGRFLENSNIDWERASRQLHFFTPNDERGYQAIQNLADFPQEIYGDSVEVEGPRGKGSLWAYYEKRELPTMRDRGSFSGVDPVKEPEKARVQTITHMLLMERAQIESRKERLLGFSLLSENPQQALVHFKEALEYWPFDKKIHEGMTKAYKALGNASQAEESERQRAALILQNAWSQYLKEPQRS